MSVEKAKAHFLGKHGHKKLNCGQAIIQTFGGKFSIPENTIDRFKNFGNGRAPEGYCGAYYAAKIILENSHPDKLKECEKMFLAVAGSTKCKEIRAARKLSCIGCVEKIAEYIEKIEPVKNKI